MTAAIALAIGIVPAALTSSSILASGEGTTTLTPAADSAGQVVLSTSTSGGTVTWGNYVQRFTGGQQCEITAQVPSDRVLAITGSISNAGGTIRTAQAGFRDGDIGVFEISSSSSPTNASQCFRVDAGSFTEFESLTLALDPSGNFSDAPFSTEPLRAGSATVTARAQSQSGTVVIHFLDPTGQPITRNNTAWTEAYSWGPKAKSGSLISIPVLDLPADPSGVLFSGIRLTTTSGSLSLRGATFDLITQAEERFCPGDDRTEGNAYVKYLGGADGSTDCFGVSLTAGPTEVRFLKPSTVATDAQFVFDVTWTLPNTGGAPSVMVPTTAIDFEVGTANLTNMPFCEALPQDILGYNSDGARSIIDYQAFLSSTAFKDFDPDSSTIKEFACIETRSLPGVTAEEFTIRDQIFVIGDLKMSPAR